MSYLGIPDEYIVAGALVAAGIIIFFILASRKNYRIGQGSSSDKQAQSSEDKSDLNPKEHYKEIRDQLTTRKKKEKVESGSGFSLMGPITAIITLVIIGFTGYTVICAMSFQLLGSNDAVAYSAVQNVSGVIGNFFSFISPVFSVFAVLCIIMIIVILVRLVSNSTGAI